MGSLPCPEKLLPTSVEALVAAENPFQNWLAASPRLGASLGASETAVATYEVLKRPLCGTTTSAGGRQAVDLLARLHRQHGLGLVPNALDEYPRLLVKHSRDKEP